MPKGQYAKGDLVAYFPADSLIPERWLKEWGLEGKLRGAKRNRVRPCKLRGEMSIGLISPIPSDLSVDEGDDVTEYFGVEKYEEPIPIQLQGKVRSRPPSFVKYDIDNYRSWKDIFVDGEEVVLTVKLHGCNMGCCIETDGTFHVCSRNMSLELDENNLYWKMAIKYDIENTMRSMWSRLGSDAPLWIMMECFGGNIQDLNYGLLEPEIRVFDIRQGYEWFEWDRIIYFGHRYNLPLVPILYEGPFSDKIVQQFTHNVMEPVSGKQLHVNEGVVIRPLLYERQHSQLGRVILKSVNDEYLLRQGGTEYH